MTVRGAEIGRDRLPTLAEYARQDGMRQWWRELILELEEGPHAPLVPVFATLIEQWDSCPDRVDDDHDEWCRACRPIVWILDHAQRAVAEGA